MNEQMVDPSPAGQSRRLPRRDLILLPLLVLLTLLVVGVGAEMASRLIYPSVETDACLLHDAGGTRGYKPNCTSWTKLPEGPWVLNQHNACGYRTREPCGPKPAGALRVAVIGSSTAAGFMVPYDDSVAARSSKALATACRRPVEFQNLGGEGANYEKALVRVDEALARQADAMVVVVSAFDIETMSQHAGDKPSPQGSLVSRVKALISDSRALYILQYFLLKEDEAYLGFWLKVSGNQGSVQRPLAAEWTPRLASLDALLTSMATKAEDSHVPLVLLFVPSRPVAAMKGSRQPWPGLDPDALSDAVGESASRHGVVFIDMTKRIPKGMESGGIYYPVNKHLNAAGHHMLSRALVDGIMASRLAPFSGCQGVAT